MNSNQQPNIWQLLWRLILNITRLYLIDASIWLFIIGLPIFTGLIIQEFFNTLTGESKYNFSPTILIIFLLATGLGRVVFIFFGRLTETLHRFTISALLRHNLLQAILKRRGVMSLPVSQGELISYFRDDIEFIEENVVGTAAVFDHAIFALTSLIILANINWKMTVLVLQPLRIDAVIRQLYLRLISAFVNAGNGLLVCLWYRQFAELIRTRGLPVDDAICKCWIFRDLSVSFRPVSR